LGLRTLKATRAVQAANILGEGILWCPRARALYWTDIQEATLWRHDPSAGRTDTWAMPERLATLALCEHPDWLLLGLATRLAFLHLPSGRLEPIMAVEHDRPTRINDGACDRQGRFVFGTLHEGEPKRPEGAFYRLDADLTLHRLDLGGVAISNSIAFSPDGGTLYYCDSTQRRIRCCAYRDDGSLGTSRDFADLGEVQGVPDGSAIDTAGGLWNAQWGLGRVMRYAPDGTADLCIEVPTLQPTRPAFGGADLNTLYITSAREGLSDVALQNDSGAGDVYAAQPGYKGLPEPCFSGTPRTLDPVS
jgi:L-arabinonolactonase